MSGKNKPNWTIHLISGNIYWKKVHFKIKQPRYIQQPGSGRPNSTDPTRIRREKRTEVAGGCRFEPGRCSLRTLLFYWSGHPSSSVRLFRRSRVGSKEHGLTYPDHASVFFFKKYTDKKYPPTGSDFATVRMGTGDEYRGKIFRQSAVNIGSRHGPLQTPVPVLALLILTTQITSAEKINRQHNTGIFSVKNFFSCSKESKKIYHYRHSPLTSHDAGTESKKVPVLTQKRFLPMYKAIFLCNRMIPVLSLIFFDVPRHGYRYVMLIKNFSL